MSPQQSLGVSSTSSIGEEESSNNKRRETRLAFHPLAVSWLLRLCTYPFVSVKAPFEALAHWEQYTDTGDEQQRGLFLARAHWLVRHEVGLDNDAGGWPLTGPHPTVPVSDSWLSALVQGLGLSVVLRAYQVTHEEYFLQSARRVARTFEHDILDGGVCAPIAANGVCFEEVAVYPAAHLLSGFICALCGLDDYVTMTNDRAVEHLAIRGHDTLHRLCKEYDTGYWTRAHLLEQDLAPVKQHALHAGLLNCFAAYTRCEICATYAHRWRGYRADPRSCLLVALHRRFSYYRHLLAHHLRTSLFPMASCPGALRVGIPVTAFPVTGGTHAVLSGLTQIMQGYWQTEYVTPHVGPRSEGHVIHRFGTAWTHAAQFPAVWLYCLAGTKKLILLLRNGANYQLLLPQDGVFSAAFAGVVGKLIGIRVVAMDHGNLTLLDNEVFHAERIQHLARTGWLRPRQLLAHLQFRLYWPSLKLLASISTRYVDHFLIPGVEGDDETEACTRLGIGTSRVTRFNSMIDLAYYAVPDVDEIVSKKLQCGIASDAIVIALVCRLAPEKGVDTALHALTLALSTLTSELRERIRVIVAGDGLLFQQMERQVTEQGLNQFIVLWGDTLPAKVKTLLSLSDIFLYTSIRGACLSVSVLEAMASACAVIATPLPQANVRLLADGRGMIVPANDAAQTSEALLHLINNPELCHRMGQAAREYVARYHNAEQFRRTLMRVAGWPREESISSDN